MDVSANKSTYYKKFICESLEELTEKELYCVYNLVFFKWRENLAKKELLKNMKRRPNFV